MIPSILKGEGKEGEKRKKGNKKRGESRGPSSFEGGGLKEKERLEFVLLNQLRGEKKTNPRDDRRKEEGEKKKRKKKTLIQDKERSVHGRAAAHTEGEGAEKKEKEEKRDISRSFFFVSEKNSR